jgi:WD40 repeat protein
MPDFKPHASGDARQANFHGNNYGPIQLGDNNTQVIYTYNDTTTWADDLAPTPLVTSAGKVTFPYRGLNAFDERDAALFFGRDDATSRVLARMSDLIAKPGLLAVSGVSGAGKSSLIRAGVLPNLRGAGLREASAAAGWPCLVFKPGPKPLDELAIGVAALGGGDVAAIRNNLVTDPSMFGLVTAQAARSYATARGADPDSETRLILVVDQFEQIFSPKCAEQQRAAFVTALHAAATDRYGPHPQPAGLVVFVVRADFEARCANYPQLTEAIQNRYLVTAMTRLQLRLAITGPAKAAGSHVADDLVELLLDELGTHTATTTDDSLESLAGAGMLPLLSHVLDQAWRRRKADELTVADYELAGGLERAVADSAQRAYDALTAQQREIARRVFIRLTATTADGTDTAVRAPRSALADDAAPSDLEDVLNAFAAEGLITLGDDTVQISHEVLFTAWPLLRDTWLAETRADRIISTRLQSAAADWNRNNRNPSYLYTGSVLEAARDAVKRMDAAPNRHTPPAPVERKFLEAGIKADQRRARKSRVVTAALVGLVIVLAISALAAYRSSQDAKHQRDIALSNSLINQSEILGDTNATISKLESLAAWSINPSGQAHAAMLQAAARRGIAVLPTGQPITALAFSPDLHTLATSHAGSVSLWDGTNGNPIADLFVGDNTFEIAKMLVFSPDGRTLASSGNAGRVRLWDVPGRRQIGPLGPATISGIAVAFSPDGRTLTTGDGATIHIWDVATRREISTRVTGRTERAESLVFSPDGGTLATCYRDGEVDLWGIADGRQIAILPANTAVPYVSAVFSPDGRTLATSGNDRTVRLWNSATGFEIGDPFNDGTGTADWHDDQLFGGPLGRASGQIQPVAFSPDGRRLAIGGHDGTVRFLDLASGRGTAVPLIGNAFAVGVVIYSPDGRTLAVGDDGGTVRLWDPTTNREIGDMDNIEDSTNAVMMFSPDGRTLATDDQSGTVRLWNAGAFRPTGEPLIGHTGLVHAVRFSPDGRKLITVGDQTVRRWDMATRREIGAPFAFDHDRAVQPVDLDVVAAAFSPDGRMVAAGDLYGTVRLWDSATGREIGDPMNPVNEVGTFYGGVEFSPDGRTLAIVSGRGDVRFLDAATGQDAGKSLQTSASGFDATTAVFSPDGRTVAIGVGATIHLVDMVSRRDDSLEMPYGSPAEAAFSPDGRTLAVSQEGDGVVRFEDVSTRRQIGDPLTGGVRGITTVMAFSPDGRSLATGSGDGAVRLWDIATRREVGAPLIGHTGPITSVAFSPDGHFIAAGGEDRTVHFWDVGYLPDAKSWVCRQINRSFTRNEWSHYAPGVAYRDVCPGK